MPIKSRGSSTHVCDVMYSGIRDDESSPPVPVYYDVIVPYPEMYEQISYENNNYSRFGNCSHFKQYVTSKNSSTVYSTDSPWECTPAYVLSEDYRTKIVYLALNEISHLNAEAYHTMKPSLRSGFSLSNFLIELVQIKTMFKFWQRGASYLRQAGGQYLNYQFGWKLFLQDCNDIYQNLAGWKQRLAQYKALQNQVHIRRFKKELPTRNYESIDRDAINNEPVFVYKFAHDDVFHATMKYRYTVPKINTEHADVLAVLDVFGLDFDKTVLWNAFPFSFVADWFWGVGDYLQSRQTDHLASVVEILDYCYSVKSTVKIEQFYERIPPLDTLVDRIKVADSENLRYTRQRCIPNGDDFGIVASHRYGTKQKLLSAALLSTFLK